jgi:hypothetical protein
MRARKYLNQLVPLQLDLLSNEKAGKQPPGESNSDPGLLAYYLPF